MNRLAAIAGLLALSAQAQQLVFEQLPVSLPLGSRSPAVTIERRNGVTPITSGNTNVTISADSPVAQVAAMPEPWATWGPTLQLSIGPGSSRTAPFYVRDGRPGVTAWAATANGFTAADGGVLVRTDAVTCDFETNTLLDTDVPAGCFNTRYAPYVQSFIAPSASSAHRGSFGVLVSDGEAGSGDAADTAVYQDGAAIFGTYNARAWLGVRSTSSAGSIIVAQLTNALATSPSVVDVRINTTTGKLSVGGFVADANYLQTDTDAGLSFDEWHLVEFAATGVGTRDGGRSLWVDGTRVSLDEGVDFSGGRLSVARLAIGEPYAQDRAWLGRLDFDDVRSAAVPLASTLRMRSATGVVGDCVPITLDLLSSFSGDLLGGPEAFIATVDAGTALFSDPACATPGNQVAFDAGQGRAVFSLRPSATQHLVVATCADFLPSSAVLTFSALDAGVDAGTPDAGGVVDSGVPDAGGPDSGVPDAGEVDAGLSSDAGAERTFAVGCSCGIGGDAIFVLAVLSLCSRRRAPPSLSLSPRRGEGRGEG